MNTLFDELLDISKLQSRVLVPNISDFAIASVLKFIESTFGAGAREKGLSFRIVPSRVWVRSDPVLLQRILSNLVIKRGPVYKPARNSCWLPQPR